MKVLVTGVAGQLGYDVVKELNKRGYTTIQPSILNPESSILRPMAHGLGPNSVIGVDRSDFDIVDEHATEAFITNVNPDAVIHCAAYTAVDAAEDNVDLCRKINVDGTENIAKACAKIGAKMFYISTDYVFDDSSPLSRPSHQGGDGPRSGGVGSDYNLVSGTDHHPYALRPMPYALDGFNAHEVDDKTNPLNVYGKSKLDGELVVKKHLRKYFIVRTSWVFGQNGNNFVKTMLRLGKEREQLTVVNDQIGSPTYTVDLARLLVDMIQTDKYGTYHGTNEGYCSWADFAAEIMKQAGLKCKIVPISTEAYLAVTSGEGGPRSGGRGAKRPFNSRLSKDCLDKNGFDRLPKWQEGLRRYLGEIV